MAGLAVGLVFLAREVTPAGSAGQPSAPERPRLQVRAGSGELLTQAAPEAFAEALVLPGQSESSKQPTYFSGQVMVSAQAAESLVRTSDLRILRPAGPAGFAVVAVPEGQSAAQFMASLDAAGVQSAPVGRVFGAHSQSSSEAPGVLEKRCLSNETPKLRAEPAQWHLELMEVPVTGLLDLSGVTVAVLDTGVAYVDDGELQAALSLSTSAIVAPYDFVNADAVATDDHMHGTHIASLIASSGSVEGVAPGVTLMPVKVLDEDNSGSEVALLDGIAWAVANEADVINLSLSFGSDYRASPALVAALDAAINSGAVVVAASGNSGERLVTWPAAHPQVISVGATGYGKGSKAEDWIADYSNRSTTLDLLAPGGDLSVDANKDGYPDGILAESIYPQDPSQTGLWFMAGTSQATALVSGSVALALANGAESQDVFFLLQGAHKVKGKIEEAEGSGTVHLDGVLKESCSDRDKKMGPFHVAVLPMAEMEDGLVQPYFVVTVESEAGKRAKDLEVVATLSGSASQTLSCKTDKEGVCTLEPEPMLDGEQGLVWSVSVDTIVDKHDRTHHPTAMFYVSDELEIFLSAIEQDEVLSEGGIGPEGLLWAWEDEEGEITAYSANAGGSGLVTAPLGLVFTPKALRLRQSSASYALDLDGSGLVTAPLGFFSMRLLTLSSLDGSGLVTTPLGFASRTFMVLNGRGGGDFGLSSATLNRPDHGSDALLGLSSGESVWMVSTSAEVPLLDTATGSFLGSGGWVDSLGYSVVDQLAGSGAVWADAGSLGVIGASTGAHLFEPLAIESEDSDSEDSESPESTEL